MRYLLTMISCLGVLLVSGQQAFAEKPYQTIHSRKPAGTNKEHIQAQSNEYFNGQFSSENDIVMNPVPTDDEDSRDNE
jgi:hypothetical protein